MSREYLCPIYEQCGNCTQMLLSEEEERRIKSNVLQRLISTQSRFTPSPSQIGYRYRIRLRSNKDGQMGYYKPKTHQHIPVQTCVIAHSKINAFLQAVPAAPKGVESIEIRTNGESLLVNVYSTKKRSLSHRVILDWIKPYSNGIHLNGKWIHGDKTTDFDVLGVKFQFSSNTFFQVNPSVNLKVLETIHDYVDRIKPIQILDTFAGAGNIGLTLAYKGYTVTLLESNQSAVKDAKEIIKRNKIKATVIQQNAYMYKAGSLFYDLLILDPPRAGCGSALEQYLMTQPSHIIYLSCNPTTLKQDIMRIQKKGYGQVETHLFDMFPMTKHVETLCFFQKV